jgi:hypothetical protein
MSERGRLEVDVTGNASGFRQVLNTARQHAKQFSGEVSADVGRSWGGIGKGMVGGIAAFMGFEFLKSTFDSFLQKASGIREMSEQLEMSAEATQKWEKAADRLGISFGTVQAALTAIQSKRVEALRDPKAASIFEQLGIDRKSVIDLEGVNSSDFAKMVMKAAGQNPDARRLYEDIVGRRGEKTRGTADTVDSEIADFSDASISVAAATERGYKKMSSLPGRLWAQILTKWPDLIPGFPQGYLSARWLGTSLPDMGSAGHPTARATGQMFGPPAPTPGESQDVHDPLISVREAQAAGRAERTLAADERIEEARRRNMTRSEARNSEEKERLSIQKQIAELEKQKPPENLTTEDEKAEWKTHQYEKIAALKVRDEALKAELRQLMAPPTLSTNSLAHSGLFSASALNFSTDKSMERAQLDVLRQIERNTNNKGDNW